MDSKERRYGRSIELFEKAARVIPGGVNSPVRAFGGVGGTPIFIRRAEGAYMWDEDGNRYIDYINSWGPTIVGHSHPEVVEVVTQACKDGFSYGAPTAKEIDLAERISELMPAMEVSRLVSSGTEACMSVIRLARAYTKRDKIIKFTGCYHGHADSLLVKAGSGVLTLGLPNSPGVPEDFTKHTLLAEYNNMVQIEELFAKYGSEIAGVILEPICGNTGFIRPEPDFINGLRKITKDHGALLIFDEVMTGFRVSLGGAQSVLGIKPDLVTLGKVIGGGMPIGAYGGSREIMNHVAPAGSMYQAGTLSGNPLAVACGLKTLEILGRSGVFAGITERTVQLVNGFRGLAEKHKIPFIADSEGGMFGFFFGNGPIRSHEEACQADMEKFNKFFHGMLDRGVYLAPSGFEAGFVSLAHNSEDIDATVNAANEVLTEIS